MSNLPDDVHVSPQTGRVCVDVTLRRTADGKEVKCIDDVGWTVDGEPIESALSRALFMWSHGNYACDCNRHLFFERALGNDPDARDVVCSHDRYEVIAPAWLVPRQDMKPITTEKFHAAVAAHGELGKALDTAVFAAPEETSWRVRAFGAAFDLIHNLGMRVFLDEEFDILESTLLTVETGLMLSSDPEALIEAIRLRALRDKIGAMRK